MSRIDWPALMRAGLQSLKLRPKDFWALTPAELWIMLGFEQALAPMARSKLDELIQAFPDEKRASDGRD